jgi:hypothetical protein
MYFDNPTQVMWFDVDANEYKRGIAYCDEVICACCGGIISIEEIVETCPKGQVPIYSFDSWIDLSESICEDNFDWEDYATPHTEEGIEDEAVFHCEAPNGSDEDE